MIVKASSTPLRKKKSREGANRSGFFFRNGVNKKTKREQRFVPHEGTNGGQEGRSGEERTERGARLRAAKGARATAEARGALRAEAKSPRSPQISNAAWSIQRRFSFVLSS